MKKLLPDLLVIFMFAVLSFAYFFPADIENRILFQHDTAPVQVPDKKRHNIAKKLVSIHAGLTLCSVVCRLIR